MSRITFDVTEANELADKYGKLLCAEVEYRFLPVEEELRIRFYLTDGRKHGVLFKLSPSVSLASVFSEAKDALLDRMGWPAQRAA